MTWFVDAFSVMGRAARTTLNVASNIVKPLLSAIIAVTPGIANAARTLAVIPVIGQAAVTVAQAAMVVQSVATTARDIIVAAENFQARTFPTKPAPQPEFVPKPVPAMPVASTQPPKRLPTPEEIFGVLPQRQVAAPNAQDLHEILELLDEPVEDVTTSFANMTIGVPKTMKTGHTPWGLGTEPRRNIGLEKRPWSV